MKRIVIIIALILKTILLFGQDDTRTLDDYFDGFVEMGISPLQSNWEYNGSSKYYNEKLLTYYHIGLTYNPVDWAFISGDVKTYFYDETGEIGYDTLDSDYHLQIGLHYSFVEIGVNYYNWNSNRFLTNNVDPVMSLEDEWKELYIAFIVPENKWVNGYLNIGMSPLNEDKLNYCFDDIATDYVFNTEMSLTINPAPWLYGGGTFTSYFLDREDERSFTPILMDFSFCVGLQYNNFEIGFRHYCSHPTTTTYYCTNSLIINKNRGYEEIFIKWYF